MWEYLFLSTVVIVAIFCSILYRLFLFVGVLCFSLLFVSLGWRCVWFLLLLLFLYSFNMYVCICLPCLFSKTVFFLFNILYLVYTPHTEQVYKCRYCSVFNADSEAEWQDCCTVCRCSCMRLYSIRQTNCVYQWLLPETPTASASEQ